MYLFTEILKTQIMADGEVTEDLEKLYDEMFAYR